MKLTVLNNDIDLHVDAVAYILAKLEYRRLSSVSRRFVREDFFLILDIRTVDQNVRSFGIETRDPVNTFDNTHSVWYHEPDTIYNVFGDIVDTTKCSLQDLVIGIKLKKELNDVIEVINESRSTE
jgi:hypothetical protein